MYIHISLRPDADVALRRGHAGRRGASSWPTDLPNFKSPATLFRAVGRVCSGTFSKRSPRSGCMDGRTDGRTDGWLAGRPAGWLERAPPLVPSPPLPSRVCFARMLRFVFIGHGAIVVFALRFLSVFDVTTSPPRRTFRHNALGAFGSNYASARVFSSISRWQPRRNQDGNATLVGKSYKWFNKCTIVCTFIPCIICLDSLNYYATIYQ